MAHFTDIGWKTSKRLSNLGTQMHVEAGTTLTTAGGRGRQVLVVRSGTATCHLGESVVAHFGPGDFFGEVAALDNGPRTATVVAVTDMELVVLSRREFEMLVESSPEIANRVLKAMAERLRRANAAAVA